MVDYYLDIFVFPKECKDFEHKILMTSADMLKDPGDPLVTGFAGTMESQWLMPRAIKQRNLPELDHTDAQVTCLMLREQNQDYLVAQKDNQRLSTEELLIFVKKYQPKVSVIIDVGAQMVDSSNHLTAMIWLRLEEAKAAAVYFDEKNEMVVTDRDGTTELYASSRFRDSPHECLFFIDDYHTRGVDIALPDDYRAAVTLGPKLTRDRLMQSAMRMRKLDSRQSLCTVAPPEVHAQILKLSGKVECEISTSDVVEWSLEQTDETNESLKPLYIKREISHLCRKNITSDYAWKVDENLLDDTCVPALIEAYKEPEALPVQIVYAPTFDDDRARTPLRMSETTRQLPEMRHLLYLLSQLPHYNHLDAEVEIQAEKEIAKESHREKESSPPRGLIPRVPSVSATLRKALSMGRMDTADFLPAFRLFETLLAEQNNSDYAWYTSLFVTTDFVDTVEKQGSALPSVLRTCYYVLSFRFQEDGALLLISQFEANEIMSGMKKIREAHLHLYTPCVSRSSGKADELTFYNYPPIPEERDWHPDPKALTYLQIFAGQTCFGSRSSYEDFCAALGILATGKTLTVPKFPYYDDTRFVSKKIRESKHWHESPFDRNPLPFVKQVYDWRLQGREWSSSTIGKIVDGKEVGDDEFGGNQVVEAEV